MSHSKIRCREEVDSRLLMVGSQTANLIPGPFLPITWVADVQMANARHFGHLHFKTFPMTPRTPQMRDVLASTVEF
jgi:hypothetical protein